MAKPTAAFVCNNPINISVTGVSPTSRSHQDLVACIEVLTTEKLSLSADLSCAIKEISRMNAELTTALSMENESSAGAFEELQILSVKQSRIMERRLKNISDLAAAEEALKIFERSEAQPQIFATNLADITGTSLFFGHITVHFLVHLLSFTTCDPTQFLRFFWFHGIISSARNFTFCEFSRCSKRHHTIGTSRRPQNDW